MLAELWSREKDRLSDILTARVLYGKQRVSCREILQGNFPEIFKAYIKQQAHRIYLHENPIRVLPTDRFDLEKLPFDDELQALTESFVNETLFTRQEVHQFAKLTVHFKFDVMVRPRQTIERLLYEKTEAHNKDDLLVVLQGLGDDRPFIQKLLYFLENLDTDDIDYDRFKEITRFSEKEVYKSKPISAILIEISHLNELEESITGKNRPGIQTKWLLGMLLERGLNRMVEGLKEEVMAKSFWTYEEVENALERNLVVGSLEEITSDENGELTFDFQISKPTPELSNEIVTLEEIQDIETTVDNSFSFEQDDGPVTDSIRIQFAEGDEPALETKTFNGFGFGETLIINRKDIETQPPGPYPNLRTLINPKTRKVFIKKIFSKNKEAYSEFIERLEQLDRWKDAKALIDSELFKRNISPYSKEAVLLGDVVFSRYFSK
ncbi:MAG: hypothetical protein ACE5HO_15550 [bacterium]